MDESWSIVAKDILCSYGIMPGEDDQERHDRILMRMNLAL
jgi:hypothetical protein